MPTFLFSKRKVGIKQIVYVKVHGNRCTIALYEGSKAQGYTQVTPIACGYVGKMGASRNKREGDMKTPLGLFPLLWAFGTAPALNTGLDYRPITHKSRWCCNPKSRRYNQPTHLRWEKPCEDMWKYRKEYVLGAVIGYNTEDTTPYVGSAIFLHCKNEPTAGCIATDKFTLKNLLRRLEKRKNPHIYVKKFRILLT